jgi:hypothetical protein
VINRRPSTSGGREWGEGGVDDGVDEEADEEAENNKKREEEFSRLNSKFTGRKDAIDEIMKNVLFDWTLFLLDILLTVVPACSWTNSHQP